MNKEQSLLLAIRHQLSVLGYSENEINEYDGKIEKFVDGLIFDLSYEVLDTVVPVPGVEYKYYMHINDPAFNKNWAYDALMCTFESECDWDRAVEHEDIATCKLIIAEVEKFCQTHRVPSSVVDFYKETPKKLIKPDWDDLQYVCIVDAFCDQGVSEYVDGITGQ